MNILDFDIKTIEELVACYEFVRYSFGYEEGNLPSRIKKKIRKHILKLQFRENIPNNLVEFIGNDVETDAFIDFFDDCQKHIKELKERKKHRFYEVAADLGEDEKQVLFDMISTGYAVEEVSFDGECVKITTADISNCRQQLIFKNAIWEPTFEFEWISFENSELSKLGEEFVLTGEMCLWEEETKIPFTLKFSDVSLQVSLYRSEFLSPYLSYSINPWLILCAFSGEILNKFSINEKYLNRAETDLLPLIKDLSSLDYVFRSSSEPIDRGLMTLRGYLEKYGFKEIIPLFDKLEVPFNTERKNHYITTRIVRQLSNTKYEPLWRELFALLNATQAGYPSRICKSSIQNDVQAVRDEIQERLEKAGYSGTYPVFIKHGELKKIRTVESYGTLYFVGKEKNAVHHIYCAESAFGEQWSITFLCGVELLRKNQTEGDIFSCCFDGCGRRYCDIIEYMHNDDTSESLYDTSDIKKIVNIAVKKAELANLTREERRIGGSNTALTEFLFMTLIMGVLFGIFMTLGLMVIAIILALFVGAAKHIPDMLISLPWWQVFAATVGLFGVAITVIAFFARRK